MGGKNEKISSLVKAGDLISAPLIFVNTSDTIQHAASVLLDRNISGAPVLDHLGQPVGVITKTDIIRYERGYIAASTNEEARLAMRARGTLEFIAEGKGFHRESEEDYVIRWMTPKIYTVSTQASLADVIREMVTRHVHRLFVRDEKNGKLAGVITTFDLLQFLARVFMIHTSKRENKKITTS